MNDETRQLIQKLRTLEDRVAQLEAANLSLSAADILASVQAAGTWTPALAFGGASTGITYSGRAGYYVKTGGLCFVKFSLTLSSKGSATGNATVAGLPFTNANDYDGAIVRFYTNMAGLTGTPWGYIGGTSITLAMPAATTRTILTDANFANNTRLDMWACYKV